MRFLRRLWAAPLLAAVAVIGIGSWAGSALATADAIDVPETSDVPETALVVTEAPATLVLPTAIDITKETQLWDGHRRGWFGTYPQDWDMDGDVDVLVSPHGGTRFFMQNDGSGTFTEIFHRVIPPDDRHGCAWGDPNGDGRPDLYCTIGAGRGTQRKANELWVQREDGTFEDVAGPARVVDPYGRGREAGWLDANGDPWPDLYVSNQYPRNDRHTSRNKLFLGVDGEMFRRAPKFGLDGNGGNPLNVHGCVVAADYDGDGREDLLTCGQRGILLYRNLANERFTERARREGVRPGLWYQAHLVDMNGDGTLDLVGVTPDGLVIQLRGVHRFGAAMVRRFSEGRQVAPADVNGDGDLDLYVVRGQGKDGNLPDLMLMNHGNGRDYTPLHLPQMGRRGVGDSVSAADLDGDGIPEMLVTHGGEHHKGPLQVIRFLPGAPASAVPVD